MYRAIQCFTHRKFIDIGQLRVEKSVGLNIFPISLFSLSFSTRNISIVDRDTLKEMDLQL